MSSTDVQKLYPLLISIVYSINIVNNLINPIILYIQIFTLLFQIHQYEINYHFFIFLIPFFCMIPEIINCVHDSSCDFIYEINEHIDKSLVESKENFYIR